MVKIMRSGGDLTPYVDSPWTVCIKAIKTWKMFLTLLKMIEFLYFLHQIIV